jgi:hypothetical protein
MWKLSGASLRAGRKLDWKSERVGQISHKYHEDQIVRHPKQHSGSREAMAGPEGGSREALS